MPKIVLYVLDLAPLAFGESWLRAAVGDDAGILRPDDKNSELQEYHGEPEPCSGKRLNQTIGENQIKARIKWFVPCAHTSLAS